MTAVLVIHNGVAWLPRTLAALRALHRRPDRIIAVDTGSQDGSNALLEAEPDIDEVLHVLPDTTFGGAVSAAEHALGIDLSDRAEADAAGVVRWLWLLHDDCAPEPDALAALLAEADRSPSASILGPKVRGWHDQSLLVECGLSITNSGRRFTGVAVGDRDQGQLDHLTDVLAVGSAGMLVRRDTWQRLEGFDPRLPMFGDDVEFCMRARRADERVLVVPAAVVHHREAGLHGVRTSPTTLPPSLAGRAAGLYTALVHGPAWLLPISSTLLLLRTLATSLLLLPSAGPRRAAAELRVWFGVHLHPVRVVRARRRLRRVAQVPRRDLAALRPGLLEQWGVAAEGSDLRPRASDRQAVLRRPLGLGSALGVAAVLAVVAAIATRAVWSGRGQLAGGALLPAVDGTTLWSAFRASWHDVGLGSAEPAAAYPLALISLAAPPGVSVEFVVSTLLLFTVPLAGASAYLALRGLPGRAIRVGLAVAYALTPAAVVPSLDGRLGTAAVAILLPWLGRLLVRIFGGASTAGVLPEASVRTAASATLVLAVCAAFVPLLWVAATVLVVLAAIARARTGESRFAAVLLVLGPPALLWPWSGALLADPSRVMFEAGISSESLVAAEPPGWRLLLLDPGTVSPMAAWTAVPLVVLAALALLWSRSRPIAVWGWLVVAVGLIGATVATTQEFVPVGATTAQHGFAAPMLLLMAVGFVMAVAAAALQPGGRLRWQGKALGAAVLVGLAAGPGLLAFLWMAELSGPLGRTDETIVPAFVTEEAVSPDRIRTLLVEQDGPDAVKYALINGTGGHLGDADVAPPAQTWAGVSRAVGELVAGVGPQPVEDLADAAVRYVVADTDDAELTAALDGNSALRRLSTSGGRGLWEVAGLAARATAVSEAGDATAVPVGSTGEPLIDARVPAEASADRLVVAQTNDGGWLATVNGESVAVSGDSTTVVPLPADGAEVVLVHDQQARARALLVPLAALLVVALLLLARRRPDDEAPDPDRLDGLGVGGSGEAAAADERGVAALRDARGEGFGAVQTTTPGAS